jgi:putative CocE/NonD family hydrolase
MVDVNVQPFEIEMTSRHGDVIRADVYLPKSACGPFPVLLGASPYQKVLRPLPVRPAVFPFIEYGPIQLYLNEGYAHVAMDTPGMGRSGGVGDPVSRAEGEAIHDMIEHVANLDWAGPIGMIGMSHYCWSQWNAATATSRPAMTRVRLARNAAHSPARSASAAASRSYSRPMTRGALPALIWAADRHKKSPGCSILRRR